MEIGNRVQELDSTALLFEARNRFAQGRGNEPVVVNRHVHHFGFIGAKNPESSHVARSLSQNDITGVKKDKNGKKIFEGDILRQKTTDKFKQYNDFEWERYGIVRFGEHDFRPDYAGYSTICFYVESIKSVAINPLNYAIGGMSNGINQYYALDENYPYEVIGNIFDSPELLEENNT